MSSFENYFDKKTSVSFFGKFLGCFFILYLFFPFWRGVTGVGGIFYSVFLDRYVNIVRWLTTFLTQSAKLLLQLSGYHVYQNNYRTLRIDYSRGIIVNPSCLGWAVMSFWVAFVFANTGTKKHKMKWMIAGVAAICILNIVRIALIALANHLQWAVITSLDHHLTFNIASYGCIFLLMFWYIKVQKKYERFDFERKQSRHAAIPV